MNYSIVYNFQHFNSVFNRGKYAVPSLFNGPERCPSTSVKALLFKPFWNLAESSKLWI